MEHTRVVRRIRFSLWLVIAVLFAGGLLITHWGERRPTIYIMTGQSMEPTVTEGEWFVAWSPPDRLERGDLIIFRFPAGGDELHVLRRLVAMPGDTIAMDSGTVLLNGMPQPWAFVIPSPATWRSELAIEENIYSWGPWVVPPDSVVLLSDRRDMLGWPDSRFLGFVARDDIRARADFTLRGRRLR